MSKLRNWSIEHDEHNIAWLTIDMPDTSTNTLSREVLEELDQVLATLAAEPPAGLVVLSGKESGFIAGADINQFPQLTDKAEAIALIERGQKVFDALEQLPCPTVCWINGVALGGGLELALCCDYRLMRPSHDRTLGLPEVQLGLHPGLGGTVRTVRLLGVRNAMDLMLTGRSLSAHEGKKRGLIDGLVPADNMHNACVAILQDRPPKRQPALLDKLLALPLIRNQLAGILKKQVAAKAPEAHYPAPFAIVDLWLKQCRAADTAYIAEAHSFAELLQTDASRNLVRVFFLQDGLKREPAVDIEDAKHVHVIGAGVMGGDIAAWCVLKGLTVTLQDREKKYIEPALQRANELFQKRLRDPDLVADADLRLAADVDGKGIAQADVIIEAIFENLEAKQALFKELETKAKPTALLTSNTSSIPLEQIAEALDNPGRLAGLHFFNPVAKMPLIEVIYTDATDADAIARCIAFSRQIGKLPLRCKSSPGFLVNRVLGPYLDEAMRLYKEGVPPEVIDKAAKSFGMPMGPVELSDTVGLDIALHVAEGLADITGRPVPDELRVMVDKGELGRKSGRGFYEYQNGKPVRQSGNWSGDGQLVEKRLVLSLLNECAQCLQEGVVETPDEADAGVIFGTGFAPFRGGPMHYGSSLGILNVTEELATLEQRFGTRFKASAGWQQLAKPE